MSIEKRNNILGDEELDGIAGGVDNQSKFEEINGSILEILPNSGFTVQLDNGEVIKAYTAGALTWLHDNGIKFDYGVGISSGAVYLCLYELGRMDALRNMSCDYATRSDIVGAKALLSEKHYVAYINLFKHYLLDVEKVDLQPLKDNKANIEVGAYDLKEGETKYYGPEDIDNGFDLLRGTCALPIASAVVEVGGKRLLDGGITKMIPIERAIV